MNRLIALLFGSFVTCLAISADELTSKEQKKPQYERLLQGEDAKKAENLEKKIEELEEADEYEKVIEVSEELFQLRSKLQGKDHWETVNRGLSIVVMKKLLGSTKSDRALARQARADNETAMTLNAQGKYAEAQPLYQKALEIRRKLLGDEDPLTALSYNNVAYNLAGQAKYAEAQPLYLKALEIFRKVVGEQHPLTATSYNNLAVNLNAQAKYAEAQTLYQKALEIRQTLLGEEHPHTADSYSNVAENLKAQSKYREAQPLHVKALEIRRKIFGENHPDTALSYNNLASILDDQAKYTEAQLLHWKSLEIRRKVFGEEHPDTATSYNNVAMNLNHQGKHLEAQPLLLKALEIRRKVFGEDHPDTALGYNNLAYNLNEQAKYTEAQPLYFKALEIHQKILGVEHPFTATSYNNIASNLDSQAKYAEAQPLHFKTLEIRRKSLGENHPDTALSYNNLASNLGNQAKYVEAQPLHLKALEIYRKIFGENHPRTALSYSNLASNLDDQAKYEEAQPLHSTALEIRRKVFGEDHPDTAGSYNNLATNLEGQGKYPEAQLLYSKALETCRKVFGEDHPYTASSYNNLANNLNKQGKQTESRPLYLKALEIRRKVLGEEHPSTVISHSDLAMYWYEQQKYGEALPQAVLAVRSYESSRIAIANKGLDRAVLGEERSPYLLLATLQIHQHNFPAAFQALEANLARGLLDEVTSLRQEKRTPEQIRRNRDLSFQIKSLESQILYLVSRKDRSDTEQKDLDQLVDRRKKVGTRLADFAAEVAQREIATIQTIQKAIPPDHAIVGWIDGLNSHWGFILKSQGEPIFEPLPATDRSKKWTSEDDELTKRCREVLQNPNRVEEWKQLQKQLIAQRLTPLEKHLSGIQHLFVVGVNRMAGIPIESLTEKYSISYIPSGTFLARLKEQPPSQSKEVLAIGDPYFPIKKKIKDLPLPPDGWLITRVFPQGNAAKNGIRANDVLLKYSATELKTLDQLPKLVEANKQEKQIEVTLWRDGTILTRKVDPGRLDVVLDKQPARQAVATKRKADQMLTSLRSDWGELPGTAVEIHRLKSLFGEKAQLLTREAATEKNLEELRQADKLKEFRYLHFATHGQTNDVKAFESALILSPLNLSKEPRVGERFFNGELSAKEVLEDWKLDAELVTLSACESGLGRQGGGDGLLGFAQAFLKAGSRSVCLSLWKVDDSATTLLMDRFYLNLLGKREGLTKPMGKAVALQEAKTWLKNLSLEQATKMTAEMSNGVARGKEKGVKLVIPKAESKSKNPKEMKPFEHPRYWAAFILMGDPN